MFAASKTASVSGGYQISRSLRFNSADSTSLNRTPASSGTRTTWTWSGWVKRSSLSTENRILSASGTNLDDALQFESSDKFKVEFYTTSTQAILVTTQVFRDPSAWYHIVLAIDTTQATSSNRMKLYVNGSQVTTFDSATYPSQNFNTAINNNIAHYIGSRASSPFFYFSGYQTEINFIDGQALTPSSFGETNAQTGVWQPKAYSGSYGTNGFYLNFSDNSNTTAATLGKDYSGNGNNWTPNNFSVTAGAGNDSPVDSPTSYGTDTGVGGTVRGNYCTLNPLDSALTLLDGNLRVGAPTDWRSVRATFGITSGKWYWEVNPGSALVMVGISKSTASQTSYVGNDANGWSYYGNTGNKYNSGTSTAYGSAYSSSDVIGVAFDADAGTLVFYKNNTSQGTGFSSLTCPYFPALGVDNGVSNTYINFGQRPFAYTAPSGFKALCTQNLPTPTIGATTATQAGKYFNPVLYSGNGSSQSVTGVGFQPDFVWVKERSSTSGNVLFDVIRGATKYLESNVTAAEGTDASTLTAFNSDGFSVGSSGAMNQSSQTYVGWNWKANGSGSTNTSGSITSTVSANTTSGFSVVTYTGTGANATVGHGLGVAPSMTIVKCRSNATTNWYTYHISIGNTGALGLNLTDATITSSAFWNNTSPTSSVFTISGASGELNGSGRTYVAYAFAEIAGYSKISSYIGNGSSDGTFVYCGFRPAYVMLKNITTSGSSSNWIVQDTTRDTYNAMPDVLFPNLSNAEASDTSSTGYVIDCLSNGFKIRNSNSNWNANNQTYIFMAFASAPFKYALAR